MGRGTGRSGAAAWRYLCGADARLEQEGRDGADRRGFCGRHGRGPGQGGEPRAARGKDQKSWEKSQEENRQNDFEKARCEEEALTPCRSTFSCRRCRPRWKRATLPSGSRRKV